MKLSILPPRYWCSVRALCCLLAAGCCRGATFQTESGDLFGIYENSKMEETLEELTVFPQLIPMEELALPPEDPFGDQRSRRRLFEDPNRPMGVREYRPEDSFRRVHWPATARTGQVQVKVYQPTSARVMVLCLNVSTYPRYWEGVYPALLERLISVAATLVSQAVEDGFFRPLPDF